MKSNDTSSAYGISVRDYLSNVSDVNFGFDDNSGVGPDTLHRMNALCWETFITLYEHWDTLVKSLLRDLPGIDGYEKQKELLWHCFFYQGQPNEEIVHNGHITKARNLLR